MSHICVFKGVPSQVSMTFLSKISEWLLLECTFIVPIHSVPRICEACNVYGKKLELTITFSYFRHLCQNFEIFVAVSFEFVSTSAFLSPSLLAYSKSFGESKFVIFSLQPNYSLKRPGHGSDCQQFSFSSSEVQSGNAKQASRMCKNN